MKDLELRDIMDRPRPQLTKLSVYNNGAWQFAELSNPIKTDDGQSFYRINKKFSLVRSTANNPKKGKLFGDPGDFVAVDTTGEMSLVSKEEYLRRFPVGNKNVKPGPTTSKKLTDQDYITKIVRGSANSSSNTTSTTTPTPSTGGAGSY